ncbi:HypC/HybG/HupF family hydrogenase formation chaperone [Intrasporangium sp. DVR]|uniref:HypC/HybG/HupF family hydrogenase formation chaperone n=1 Tax=Intrasporangium sp. DVR TaxID=3127867 RepID=UPI00313A50A2
MCLGQIAQVLRVDDDAGARVRSGAQELAVSLITLDGPVDVGDWLVVHSGFALERITAEEAHEALAVRGTAPDFTRDRRELT